MTSDYQHVEHTFSPVYDSNSQILILGSFPSVKSRDQNFYYGHPQNRFWKVLAKLTDEPLPGSIKEKKAMLLKHQIAVWDVIASCDIIGSSDSSIKNVVPSEIPKLLKESKISKIYANGDKAYRLYKKYCEEVTGIEAVKLPSTSPANAAFTLERLVEVWGSFLQNENRKEEEKHGV